MPTLTDVPRKLFGVNLGYPFAGFAGVFMALALWVPYVVTAVSAGIYLLFPVGHPAHDAALVVAVLATSVAWFVAAVAFGAAALPPAAHAEAYDRIGTRISELNAWVDLAARDDAASKKAQASAQAQLTDAKAAVGSHGVIDTRWVMATGYIGVWRALHQAEAEMFHYAPDDYVVREATRDALRLDGSEIPQRATLLGRLKAALTTVSPTAAAHLDGAQPAAGAPGFGPTTPQGQAARAVLGEIHHSVSEYRDDLRSGIVRHRNSAAAATVVFGFVSFAILALALSRGVNPSALGAGLAFFLTGSVMGIFGRLWSDTGNQSAEDDYGLSIVRLVQTPLFSGLAAVIAAVVFPLLYANSVDESLKLATPGIDLLKVLDLVTFPFGLFLALVFGLSPGILLDRLHQAADDYKKELLASKAASAK